MKIRCACDNIIVDQTDYLKYNGYLISDTQWFDFWDSIDEKIKSFRDSSNSNEDTLLHIKEQSNFKTLWECIKCGKLYIEGENGNTASYSADSEKYNQILNKRE